MTRIRTLTAGLTLLAAFPVWGQSLPAGYPKPIFEWAVATDLAGRVGGVCRGMTFDTELADAQLGVALAQAFRSAEGYLTWSNRAGKAAEEAAVAELVIAENLRRGRDAGYDLTKAEDLCAYGRAQATARTAAGQLLSLGGS